MLSPQAQNGTTFARHERVNVMPSTSRLAALLLALILATPVPAAPPAAEAALQAARAGLERGDGIAAEADLKRALAAGATRAEVAAPMGEALVAQGDLRRARPWLEPGQFSAGTSAWGWRALARLERLDGNLPAAGRALDRALAAPADPLVWVEIGRLRYAGGEQIEAIAAAERALAVGPDNIRALELRAQLLRDAQGPAAALPLYERALKLAPDDLSLLGGQAAALGDLGRARAMLAVTRHMIALAPRQPQAWFLQAALAARAGQVDLARGLLARAGTHLREVPAAMLLAGTLELEAGNAALAADQLERLVERQPANARAQLLLARALYEAGDSEDLFTRFADDAARPDAPAYLLLLLGRAYEEAGNRAAAAPLLDRAGAATLPPLLPLAEPAPAGVLAARLADAPGDPAAVVPFVRAMLAARNPGAAAQAAGRLAELHPGSDAAQALAGDVALAGGDAAGAILRYRRAAQVRFAEPLLLRLAEAMARTRPPGDGAALAAGYLAQWPGSRLAARLGAGFAAARGDWGGAARLLAGLRAGGGNRDVRLLADLSLAQLRSGDAAGAEASARQAYALAPASPVASQAWGMALLAHGDDRALAAQLLDKARILGGDNPLLAEARRQL